MRLPALPICSRSVDRSQPDRDWNKDHKHWLPATVWAAQHSAREAQREGTDPEGLYRCAACAADIKTSERFKCSKCKLVSSGCPAKAPLHIKVRHAEAVAVAGLLLQQRVSAGSLPCTQELLQEGCVGSLCRRCPGRVACLCTCRISFGVLIICVNA